MEQIKIKLENGEMMINADEFFPAGATRLRKLLKVIDEDYEHRDDLRVAIIRHCDRRACILREELIDLANMAATHYLKATELQPEIDKLTCRAGRKALLSAKKKEQRDALAIFRDCSRQFARAEKMFDSLKKNAEVVRNGK